MQQKPNPVASLWFHKTRWLFAALSGVAVGYAFVGAWLVTSGPSDPVAHTADFIEFLISPWMLATYVVAGALIAFGAWYLHSAPKRTADATDVDTAMKRQAVRLTLAWLIVAASLAAIGYLYIRDLESTSRMERSAQQQSVARLKAQQIGKWLLERMIETELLATSLRGFPLERLRSDRDIEQAVHLMLAEALAGNSERLSASLIAPDGKVLIHVGEGSAPDEETTQAAIAVAGNPQQRSSIVDVHLDGTPPQPRMVLLVPVKARTGSSPTLAVLAMAIDPFQGLLPQIEAWPTPSPSSEAVVVRREGDRVEFITPPPLLKPVPKPLEFRVPLAGSKLPAAEALVQGDGVRTGRDYRGVEVLTASRRVSGLPWTVVAKTDMAEIDQPVQQKALTLIIVIGAAVVLAAIMLMVLWRGEYANLAAFRAQQSEEHAALTHHYEQLVRMARDIVLLIRPDGLIVEANEAAVAAYGYSASELRRLNVRDLQAPEELARFDAVWDASDTADGILVEGANRRKDGTIFPVEVSGRAIEVEGKIYRQGFIRDITRRKALEDEVARLSRVQKALQAATSVLLRATAETELFQEMCEILVQLGGYRMADVAVPNNDAGKTVSFLAIAGADDGDLAQAGITWGEGPRSVGPTGGALRTGDVRVNQDLATDAQAPWREEALKRGYQACIGLPIKVHGTVAAALTLYAGQPNAFGKDEMALLVSLADDISFAVSRLRGEEMITRSSL